MNHRAFACLVIVCALLFVFVFTVIVTALSLIGLVTFANAGQQNKLFVVLIVEIVVIGVAFFKGILRKAPREHIAAGLPSPEYREEFTAIVEAFRSARDLDDIEDCADSLGKTCERSRLAAVDALLYRLGDEPVQEEPDVEDAVCRALVRLGVMQQKGNLSFTLFPDAFLSHAIRKLVRKHAMSIPRRYRMTDRQGGHEDTWAEQRRPW